MEFTVNKSELVRELSLSQGVVEKKTTIPILSNVLLEAADDRMTLTATDLELGIRCSCPARVKKEGAGTVPARKLLDYVRLLPDGDVNMKFLENHWASITSGRSRTRIAGMSRESFPELPQMPEPIARGAGEDAGLDDRAHVVCDFDGGIAVHAERRAAVDAPGGPDDGGDGRASAGLRAGFSRGERQADKPFRALMPKKAMSELIKLSDDAGTDAKAIFAGDDNHLFFQVGHRLLITRKLTGNFPDYERVLPKDHQFIAKLEKGEIRSAIERVAQFADERSRAIRVQFAAGEVRVFSSTVEIGESEETVPSEYNGPDIEIGFNAQYLLDFLRAISQDQVAFELKDQKSAGEMRPAGDGIADQYRYVVMPMRI